MPKTHLDKLGEGIIRPPNSADRITNDLVREGQGDIDPEVWEEAKKIVAEKERARLKELKKNARKNGK